MYVFALIYARVHLDPVRIPLGELVELLAGVVGGQRVVLTLHQVPSAQWVWPVAELSLQPGRRVGVVRQVGFVQVHGGHVQSLRGDAAEGRLVDAELRALLADPRGIPAPTGTQFRVPVLKNAESR